MPSSAARSLFDSRVVRSLSSIRLGIVLGFAASALLAVSSLTIPDPRGPRPLPFSESFKPFLAAFQLRYAWFWPLVAVLVLFGLNLLLSTLRSAFLRRRKAWDLRFAGVMVMHLGVIAGLVTHLAAGLSSRIERGALVTRKPTALLGHTLRLVHLSLETNPDGSLKTASATVSVDGKRRTLGYNDPLFFDGMRRFVLIQDVRQRPGGTASFSVAGGQKTVAPGEAFGPAGAKWVLGRISSDPTLRMPMVLVRPAGAPGRWQWLSAGQSPAPGVRFEGVTPERALVVIVRRNDGIPVLLAASAIFCLGLALFLFGRRRAAS